MGGIAAALVALILVVGLAGLVLVSVAIRPWLAVLLGINSGFGDVTMASLRVVNPIDIAVLALTAMTIAGFWPGPRRPHRVWMGIAVLLPLVGIGVLFATSLWGRSGLMSAGIILSALMLANSEWRAVAYVGLAANLLLLVGDFTTLGSRSALVTCVVSAGYALLVAWFVWIAMKLLVTRPAPVSRHT